MNTDYQSDIEKLNEFLSNELAAVETYKQCIDKTSSSSITQHLSELRQSHAARAQQLRERIMALGGEPVNSSGAWGSFAKMMEGGAKMFSEKSALAILEEGEDKGLAEYREDLDKLEEPSRSFVASALLPEQQRSHDQLRRIIGQRG
jgi:uncharacterized protein (TIGR02284 family)